jgi:hypothetical protein
MALEALEAKEDTSDARGAERRLPLERARGEPEVEDDCGAGGWDGRAAPLRVGSRRGIGQASQRVCTVIEDERGELAFIIACGAKKSNRNRAADD